MLEIYRDLFKALKNEDVSYCNWKDHYDVEKNLEGHGDLDLFVPLRLKLAFEEISKKIGFRQVLSYQSSHDHVEHYYGLDKSTLKFVHIHVYFKIITGEHISKNYDIPFENYILENLDESDFLPKTNIIAQNVIFLTRYFLKIGSLYGLFQYWRDQRKYSNEWKFLNHDCNFKDVLELNLSFKDLEEMKKIFKSSSFTKKILFSLRFKNKFKNFKRRSFFQYQIFIIQNLIIRIINKVFLKKQKIFVPGIVIAICGLDGTGKSTLVSKLKILFSNHFCTKVIHLGKPKSNIFTYLINIIIKIYSILKIILPVKKNPNTLLPKNISIIYAIRSVLLAYDRKVQSNKARSYSENGYIVICDRYPGIQYGKMDSPRIPENISKGFIYQFFYNLEQNLYKSIKQAKFIFQLSVSLDEAIVRNNLREKFGKETEDELRDRFLLNSDAKFLGENYYIIDATLSQKKILKQVVNELWFSKHWSSK
tara:strand:+ start:4594 stop:6027 length:1434 start_codon:yes stop_codon:yes gene_type:complete